MAHDDVSNVASNLARLIRNYADACIMESWKGSRPPEEWETIASRVTDAAEALEDYIRLNLSVTITGVL